MADCRIRTNYLWLPNRGDTPRICIIQGSKYSADDSACHGQKGKGKKSPATQLSIFLSNKNFRRKIIKPTQWVF